jgi:hypothetical protein
MNEAGISRDIEVGIYAFSTKLHDRVYIWSVVLEPFLYFLVVDRLFAGFSLTVSRLLQFVWLAVYLFRFNSRDKQEAILKRANYYYLYLLFFWVIAASVLGGISGGYISYSEATDTQTSVAELLSNFALRPLIEILLFIFNLWYYLIIGTRIVSKPRNHVYFIQSFLLICGVSLFVGYADLILYAASGSGIVTRHISEYFYSDIVTVGSRYHGLAGEPRDAVPQLLLMLGITYSLQFALLAPQGRIKHGFLLFTILTILLTQSISGLISVPIFAILYSMVNLSKFTNGKALLKFAALGATLLLCIGIIVESSDRVGYYIITYSNIFSDLRYSASNLSFDQLTQMVNIYPLFKYWELCSGENLLRCFVGSGMSSSAFANTEFLKEGLSFPQAQITRLIYETGVIGLSIYCLVFISIINNRSHDDRDFDIKQRRAVLDWGILILSVVLAHKSNNLWIYCIFVSATLRISQLDRSRIRLCLMKDRRCRMVFSFK